MSGRRRSLVTRLARYDAVCEVGIGRRPGVARALAERGVDVRATDVVDRSVPSGVRFERDDLVAASRRDDPGEVYRVDTLYALACPPELHRPLARVADRVGATALFTTLADERPVVPADSEAVGDGLVVYTVRLDRLDRTE
ncbi:MAG: UPF0146 family protein [Halobaculum sp.]